MGWAELAGLIVLLLLVLLIAFIVVRRALVIRAGGFDVNWRRGSRDDDRGWTLGQARFQGERLVLYRSFSVWPAAAMSLNRAELVLGGVRSPLGAEPDLLPTGVAIVGAQYHGTDWELALTEDALTALRSWVESRLPGSRQPGSREPGQR